MPVDEVRKLINAIDNNQTEFNTPPFKPFISKKLRELVGISEPTEPINEKKLIEIQQRIEDKNEQTMDNKFKHNEKKLIEVQQQIEDKNEQTMDKLKQIEQANDELKQQMKDMQELLISFIKNSDANKDKAE